jgi:hypothetical protein
MSSDPILETVLQITAGIVVDHATADLFDEIGSKVL